MVKPNLFAVQLISEASSAAGDETGGGPLPTPAVTSSDNTKAPEPLRLQTGFFTWLSPGSPYADVLR
jgi:hypothetical protein